MTKFLQKLLTVFMFILMMVTLSFQVSAQYCIPDYITGTGASDYIDGFEFEDISNFTGAGDDWNDYTYLSTVINPGLDYTMTFYNCPSYTEYYNAWIDYNQDEIFDADEKLSASDVIISAGSTGTITFTVPFTAYPGTTRLRIMCVYYPSGEIDPCSVGIYYYGEAEDYSIVIPASGPYDIGVTDITSLGSGCGLSTLPVTVDITNFGTEPSGDFVIRYKVYDPIDGPLPPITNSYDGPTIGSLETVSYTFSIDMDASNYGAYTVEAWSDYALDDQPLNDTSDVAFTSIPIVGTFPYYEDFEDGASGWEAGGIASDWELGSPASFTINTPPVATPTSVNSWKTDLDGDFNYGENSYVLGPCFDFTTLVQPYVEIDYWVETYTFYGYDGAMLEYSLDAGGTWASVNYLVGDEGDAENWYNDQCYSFDPFTYPYDSAWTRSSGGWKTGHYDISGLAGETQVQFRIHFASAFFTGYDGFAFDNLRIQDPYDHDIGVTTLVSPVSMPTLTSAEVITVTIENFGINDESGFPVSYQVDGGIIVSETFTGTLLVGEAADYTFAATYDFSSDGDYELCAWTGLGTDEDLSNDNLCFPVSNLVPISGTNAYYIYSNVYGGYEPWYTTTNTDAMNTVFGVGEWTQGFFETIDVEEVFGLGTCFIFMDGGDAMALELESFLTTNATAVQNWVAAGGHLFLNSAPNEGSGMDYLFGGVELNYSYYTTYANFIDATHPIFTGPYLPLSTSTYGYSFGHATIEGPGVTYLINDLYAADKYTLGEKPWGAGNVLFGSMTPNAFHYPTAEAANLRANMIAYLAICTISDNDVGVESIITPNNGCGLGSETVTVKVRNYGFDAQSGFPVKYRIDGVATYTQTFFDVIEPGETVEFTFTVPADITAPGAHNIEVWTLLATDTIYSNDSTDKIVNNVPVVSIYPYNEDFEDGASGWYTGGDASTWEIGSPAGPTISGAPPTTPTSVNSWATGLTGYYNYYENSYVVGPCFDFTTLVIPYIEMDIWWETGDFWDGARLEYSLDAGTSWEKVGDIGTGDNWYTDGIYSFGYDPVTFVYGPGWSGNSGSWVTAKHDLSFLAGEPQVQFRMHFASYAFYALDGVAFDNINIQDPYPDDIGVSNITSPASAVTMGTAEIVTVVIENYGTNTQSTFDVSYQVGAGTIHTEAYSGVPINAGESASFSFTATEDFSDDGVYTICSWTELTGDDDITNDTYCEDVVNLSPVSGTDAYYINSNVYGGYDPWYTYENQDAMDNVFGSGAWIYEHFETLDPLTVFGENTCFVFIDGSDGMAQELEDFLVDNGDLVQNWVSSGGNLLLNSAPNEGDGMDFGFDGVVLDYGYYTSNTTAPDATHPIYIGPYTPVVTDYYGTSYGHAIVNGGDITAVMVDLYSDVNWVLAEKEWGSGHVMFGGMTTPNFHTPIDEARNVRQNMIDYLKLCSPVDVGVSDLISPESGCGLDDEVPVTIQISNYGPGTVTSIPVNYTVDGIGLVSETAPGPIDAGGTYNYTFSIPADLSVAGDHEVLAWTDFSGDGDVTNDSYSATVTSLESPLVDLGPNLTICDEITIDAGNPGSGYSWSTGQTTQSIVVTETGTYSVTVTNLSTGCVSTDAITVTVNYSPTGSFTYTAVELTVTFSNTSTGGASYTWDFGDGSTSTEANPVHTYADNGFYTVSLTVNNSCGDDVYTTNISVVDAIENIELANAAQLFPNPTSGLTVIDIQFAQAYDVKFELVNTLGEIIWSLAPGSVLSGSFDLDLRNYADGVYQLKVYANDEMFTKQVILTK